MKLVTAHYTEATVDDLQLEAVDHIKKKMRRNSKTLSHGETARLAQQVQAAIAIIKDKTGEDKFSAVKGLELSEEEQLIVNLGLTARQRIILHNRPFAFLKALYVRGNYNYIPVEDAYQEACIGLARAAEKYDPKTGYKFSTYAWWWIRQSVSNYIRRNHTSLKVVLELYTLRNKCYKIIEQQRLHGNKLSKIQLLQLVEPELDVSEEKTVQKKLRRITEALEIPFEVSLNEVANSSSESERVELLSDSVQIPLDRHYAEFLRETPLPEDVEALDEVADLLLKIESGQMLNHADHRRILSWVRSRE